MYVVPNSYALVLRTFSSKLQLFFSKFINMADHFLQLLSSLGVGLHYDKRDKVRYTVRGKKSFLVTNNGLVNFVVKGRYDVDQEFMGVGDTFKFS